MDTDKTTLLASISDADLLAFVEDQYKAVAHLAKAVVELHGPHMTRHSSRGILEMQSVRAHEIMEWLGDLLNAMDGVDAEKDGWMNPIFDKANEIFGENAEPIRSDGSATSPEGKPS